MLKKLPIWQLIQLTHKNGGLKVDLDTFGGSL